MLTIKKLQDQTLYIDFNQLDTAPTESPDNLYLLKPPRYEAYDTEEEIVCL